MSGTVRALSSSLRAGGLVSAPASVLGVAAIAAAVAVGASAIGGAAAQTTTQSSSPAAAGVVWLDQNWTEDQRRRYHHQSQGTLTIPIPTSWFMALQRGDDFRASAPRFSDPASLERFGFIPSPRDEYNPLGLPIGFARTTGTDPRTGESLDRLGFTCAACHTGRIDHQGTQVLVDGGPALTNLTAFGKDLAISLGETMLSPTRFRRFANRVLGEGNSAAQRLRLHRQVRAVVGEGLGELLQNRHSASVEEGYGRLDALNRIGNTVFGAGMGIRANNAATSAPVAYPHIWDTHWFTWVQYNGSIQQPMVRNAGEAMGVGAVVNWHDGPTPRYTSTIPVDRLDDPIERSLRGDEAPQPAQSFSGLRSPSWPEQIFGRIDRDLAAQGEQLYRQQCQGCHLPAPNTPQFWSGPHWVAVEGSPNNYLDLRQIPIARIGTDPAQARDMANRTVRVPAALGLPGAIGSDGNFRIHRFGPALGEVVERVVNRWYDSRNPPTSPADRARMNGFRPNGIRAPMEYKARPLNGIWATAPFLHNGSIRTLYDLFSPFAERPRSFRLGSREFDARNVGYADAGGFELVARRRNGRGVAGNLNTGHLFDVATAENGGLGIIGPPLSPQQRRALVEYLKTL